MRYCWLILILFASEKLWSKNSFSVAPTRIEIDLSKPKTESFVILNNGDGPIRVEASIIYFPVDSKDMENGIPLNPETSKQDDLSESIRISPRLVSLAPAEQRVVRISVRPPANLKVGEYRAHVLFKMLEFTETQKKSLKDAAGKKVGMQLSFRLEMAASVIGQSGTPEQKIEGLCSITNGRAKLEVTNPAVWRFDGWVQFYNSSGTLLREEKVFVLRESKRILQLTSDNFKNEKKVSVKFFVKKEDKAPLAVAECAVQ